MVTPQQPPEFLSFREAYAYYRPSGETTLEKAVELINDVLRYCRDNEVRGVLVNITDYHGYAIPNLSDRFFFISKWAETADGKVALSIVAPAEVILQDKFGVMIATNRGLISDVFTDEAEAFEWLRATVPVARNVPGKS